MLDDGDLGIFSDVIISEILTRLPAKTLHRFKCVSKTWNSIICNPNFIISYISKSSLKWVIFDRFIRVNPDSEPEFELQWKHPPNVSTLSLNPTNLGDDSKEFLIKDHEYPVTLINSSNGLILFSIKIKRDPFKESTKSSFSWVSDEDSLYVVNQITHEWVPIPKPPEFVCRRTSLGFITEVGPTGVLGRFMIVEYQPIIGSKSATLMCFSSETWKWAEIGANYMLGMHMWKGEGVLEFDGHLIWVDPRVGIITWDDPFGGVNKGVHCRFIAVPKPRRSLDSGNRRCIDVGCGHIQFLEVEDDVLSLWRLKDYQGEEWSLVHKLNFKDVWFDDSYLGYGLDKVVSTPVVMHPYGPDVAFFMVDNRIFSLNVGTRKVESCASYCGLSKYIFLISAKLPNWPTSFSPSLKATILKEQGNVHFKANNYNGAISSYSRSIALSQNALAYANRAMAYLKVDKYHEAEADSTEALKLDGEYFKAYGRRAIARKELGDLKGCVQDVEFALKLKPDDQGMKRIYADVKWLIEKVQHSTAKGCCR